MITHHFMFEVIWPIGSIVSFVCWATVVSIYAHVFRLKNGDLLDIDDVAGSLALGVFCSFVWPIVVGALLIWGLGYTAHAMIGRGVRFFVSPPMPAPEKTPELDEAMKEVEQLCATNE
jgi:hypothetical protein